MRSLFGLSVCLCVCQRRREPKRGPGKHSRGASLGNFFFKLFVIFFKWRIPVYFIFFSDGEAFKRRGAWGNLPLPPFFRLNGPSVCVYVSVYVSVCLSVGRDGVDYPGVADNPSQ